MSNLKNKIHNIAVLSDGAWGTAIAILLHGNGFNVRLWGAFPENIREIRKTHENTRFLPGVRIPSEISLHEDMESAVGGADIIVLATPSQYMRGTLEKLKPLFNRKTLLVSLAKGIEIKSLKRMSELCEEILGKCRFVALSGPSHAEEVSIGIPTAVVAASSSLQDARIVQKTFMNKNFRVYVSKDIVGVELGGSLKNIFAIAAGIIDGMKLGDNSKAALLTRGIAEISRLGVKLGGEARTFSGLSGIGDLIVTCYSRHSRNRHVGEELGKGRKISEILSEMGLVVAEGVETTRSAWKLARRKKVEVPVINEVYNIIYKDKDPKAALLSLMSRKPKKEF